MVGSDPCTEVNWTPNICTDEQRLLPVGNCVGGITNGMSMHDLSRSWEQWEVQMMVVDDVHAAVKRVTL